MKTQFLFDGEVLRGHAGEYKVYQRTTNQAAELGSRQIDDCLKGCTLRNANRENQIWRCLKTGDRSLIISACCAVQRNDHAGGTYQHAYYANCSTEHLKDAASSIFMPFATEDDFDRASAGSSTLEKNWRDSDITVSASQPFTNSISQELRKALACVCLYNGLVYNYGKLTLIAPSNTDYLRWCRTVMYEILSCIPYGLRDRISFSTNATNNAAQNFILCFAPSAAEAPEGSEIVLAEDPISHKKLIHNLRPELQSIIYAAADDEKILDTLYTDVEQHHKEPHQENRYVYYFRIRNLTQQPLSSETLSSYESLLRDNITEQERSLILLQLSGCDSEISRILEGELSHSNVNTLPELTNFLIVYQQILCTLAPKLDLAVSQKLLEKTIPENSASLKEILEYRSMAEEYAPYQIYTTIHPDAWINLRQKLNHRVNELEAKLATSFRNNVEFCLPSWNRTDIQHAFQSLDLCSASVREECADFLLNTGLSYLDDNIRHRRISPMDVTGRAEILRACLVTDRQRSKLQNWLDDFTNTITTRRRTASKITDFISYLEVADADDLYSDALWTHIEENNCRQYACIDYLLYAVEYIYQEPWHKNQKILSEILTTFADSDRYRMGIWFGEDKTIHALLSDIHAYQALYTGNARNVHIWCKKGHKYLPINSVHKAVHLVCRLRHGAEIEYTSQKNAIDLNRVLDVLLDARMISQAEHTALQITKRKSSSGKTRKTLPAWSIWLGVGIVLLAIIFATSYFFFFAKSTNPPPQESVPTIPVSTTFEPENASNQMSIPVNTDEPIVDVMNTSDADSSTTDNATALDSANTDEATSADSTIITSNNSIMNTGAPKDSDNSLFSESISDGTQSIEYNSTVQDAEDTEIIAGDGAGTESSLFTETNVPETPQM